MCLMCVFVMCGVVCDVFHVSVCGVCCSVFDVFNMCMFVVCGVVFVMCCMCVYECVRCVV